MKCAADEVEGPAAAELVKEELCESGWDSLVEDFDLKENSFLLKKTQGAYNNLVRTKTEQETAEIFPRARVGYQLGSR